MILIASPPDSQIGQGTKKPPIYFHTMVGDRDDVIALIEQLSLDVDQIDVGSQPDLLFCRARGADFNRIIGAGVTPLDKDELAKWIRER